MRGFSAQRNSEVTATGVCMYKHTYMRWWAREQRGKKGLTFPSVILDFQIVILCSGNSSDSTPRLIE